MSQASEQFFSASSSTASESPVSDGSVCSEQLDQLLESLQLGRTSAPGRLVLSDSDSEASAQAPSLACSPPAASTSREGGEACQGAPREPAAQATWQGPGRSLGPRGGAREAGGGAMVPQAKAPPGPGLARPAAPTQSNGAVEVIDLLSSSPSSSSGGSDVGAWATARPTTQRKRQVIDSSSDDEDEHFGPSPKAQALSSSSDEGTPSPRVRRALPEYFASIGPLQSIQLNSPAKPPTQQQQPKPAAKAAVASAAPPVASKPTPQQPPTALFPQKPAPRSTAKPPRSAAAFRRQREQLVRQLYEEYNCRIFSGRLPADLEIRWNNRLSTTAGLTHYRRDIPPEVTEPPRYSAHVELSAKVLDALPKLERTLCHELCHVAAWLLDHTAKPPHGPMFKKWADRAMAVYPDLDITTCHSYEIFYAYRWQCSSAVCGQTYGRHSNSIDVTKKVCGECKGRLVFLGKFQQDGTPAKPRAVSGFSKFVQENYQGARGEAPPRTPHAEIMKTLSSKWAAKQQQQDAGSTGDGRAQEGGGAGSSMISLLDHLAV